MFGISAREWPWREERICVGTNRLVEDLESGFCMNPDGFSSSRFSSSGNRPAYPWGFGLFDCLHFGPHYICVSK